MDDKIIMEMFNKILERLDDNTSGLEAVKEELRNQASGLETMKGEIYNNTSGLEAVKEELHNQASSLEILKVEGHNNALMLEAMQINIKKIVEVQQNHMVQNERQHEEIFKKIDAENSLLERVLKRVSADIVELKEDKKSTDEILGRHEVAIKSLRRRYI